MRILVIIIAVIAGGVHYWKKNQDQELLMASQSAKEFVEVLMPSGINNNKVVIIAPDNCPREAGQRADALERELTKLGIPVERSSSGSVSPRDSSEEQQRRLEHTMEIFQGEIPAVFINGMAKSNPGINEVVAEYRRVN